MTALLLALLLPAPQDFQVGTRAKAMGGSYTAFGDDPVAVWSNPAGTAALPSQFALTYQSFVQYEFDDLGVQVPDSLEGDPEQGLLDPPISPSFAGVVAKIGNEDLDMSASLAYIRPFQIKYVYWYDDPVLPDLLTQTDQQFSRIRFALAAGKRLSAEPGFFTRVALGAGVDYVHTKYQEIDQNADPTAYSLIYQDSETSLGYGAGLLATAYESETFMVDVGLAYNSGVDFNFDLDPTVYPVWDWPALASGGLAVYLLENYSLRLTFDAQYIWWQEAVADPDPGLRPFDDTLSFSAGAEQRFAIFGDKRLYARAGWKLYDTPWGSESDLPWVGDSVLRIDTEGDRIHILTLGLGLYWSRKTVEGQVRLSGIDVAVELGGETDYLVGAGFSYQFD